MENLKWVSIEATFPKLLRLVGAQTEEFPAFCIVQMEAQAEAEVALSSAAVSSVCHSLIVCRENYCAAESGLPSSLVQ